MSNDTPIPADLWEAVRRVRVDPAGLKATVDDREVAADNPRLLRRLLANALYEVFHSGQREVEGPLPHRSRDTDFERELRAAVRHEETYVRARIEEVVHPEGEAEPHCLVTLDGVRVWVPSDRVRADDELVAQRMVAVTNTPCRPALSPGFFMVLGTRVSRSPDALRVYVHVVDPAHAPAIWCAVLDRLEETGAGYRAKVLSNRDAYPRRDSLVVYLDPRFRHLARDIADVVGGMTGLGSATSRFARRLRPGVAVAWEPRDDRAGMNGLSFGQHRASVLAEFLVETAADAAEPALRAALASANINPADPSENLDQPAIGASKSAQCVRRPESSIPRSSVRLDIRRGGQK